MTDSLAQYVVDKPDPLARYVVGGGAVRDATTRAPSQGPTWNQGSSGRQTARNWMVPGGAMAGGLYGGMLGTEIWPGIGTAAGALLGAGIGGMTGRVGYEATSGRSVPGMPQRALGAGGEQMLYEGAGLGAQPGMNALAEGTMGTALRASATVRRRIPNLSRIVLNEGGTVGLGGLGRAEAKREAASAATDRIIAAASRSGKRYNVDQVAKEMVANNEAEAQMRFGRGLTPEETQATVDAVHQRANEVLARRSGGILNTNATSFNAQELDAIRHESGVAAKAALEKLQAGDYAGANPTMDRANEASARNLLNETIPGRKAAAANEQRKIIVADALRNAQALKRRALMPTLIGGAAWGPTHNPYALAPTLLAAHVLAQPEALSLIAHALNSPLLQFGARQLPRLGGMLINPSQMPADSAAFGGQR